MENTKINHIGFIMDGNRRYGEKQNLSKEKAYKKGMENFLEFVSFQVKYNIKETTFFALSCDNYKKRPKEEKEVISKLMNLFSKEKAIEDYFIENKIQINLIGDIDELKKDKKYLGTIFLEKLNSWNKKNKNYNFKVNIAINYDGEKEILNSFQNIIKKIQNKELDISKINEKIIKKNMWTKNSKAPEIIVRPGNAPRLSGFLLWDSKYSEIYLTHKLWPELGEADFTNILSWYKNIKRNFGE